MHDIRPYLRDTTVIQGDITDILNALIPTDKKMCRSLEGTPLLEPLRTLSSQCAHTSYLNRRDTLRGKSDMNQPARCNNYNIYLASYLTGSRQKCSTPIHVHQCKEIYDWLTHSMNLAKGITDEQERSQKSKCTLCTTEKAEAQTHASTT